MFWRDKGEERRRRRRRCVQIFSGLYNSFFGTVREPKWAGGVLLHWGIYMYVMYGSRYILEPLSIRARSYCTFCTLYSSITSADWGGRPATLFLYLCKARTILCQKMCDSRVSSHSKLFFFFSLSLCICIHGYVHFTRACHNDASSLSRKRKRERERGREALLLPTFPTHFDQPYRLLPPPPPLRRRPPSFRLRSQSPSSPTSSTRNSS